MVDGDYTIPELHRRVQAAVDDPEVALPTPVLLDLSGASRLSDVTRERLDDTARIFGVRAGALTAVAILAAGQAALGLTRRIGGYEGSGGVESAAFGSSAEALSWLEASRGPGSKDSGPAKG